MRVVESVSASEYNRGARSPSLSPLAGREPERGVHRLAEILRGRILSHALFHPAFPFPLVSRRENGYALARAIDFCPETLARRQRGGVLVIQNKGSL